VNDERWWEQYKVDVPEGTSGAWRVERFTVTDHDVVIHNIRAGHDYMLPGTYTRLVRGRGVLLDVVMSDTRAEIWDLREMIHQAHGRILLNGLGLGVVLQACLHKEEVEHATVVEISPDVLALVGPHYQARFGARLTIVQADALLWQPPAGAHYDAVWHDIWHGICPDNLAQMHQLHRKYGRRSDWQGSWCRAECEQRRRQG
jgi:hypothetical protein